MRLRCELTVNGESRTVLIVKGTNETERHMAERLAGYLLFWDHEPILDAGTKLPALSNYEFLPDILALDAAGDIKLWVECGPATMHQLGKLVSRVPEGRGRIVVLKPDAREAKRLREELESRLDKPHRVEILAWPGTTFKEWLAAVGEKVEAFGETTETGFNLVVNERVFAVDLERH